VDVQGQHGLICKQAPSRIARYNVMNDIIFRSLSSAGIPAFKEPTPECLFVPIALEALGAIAPCSLDFLTEVDRRLSAATGDARETALLFQRISVALQRFNAVFTHKSFVTPDVGPDL